MTTKLYFLKEQEELNLSEQEALSFLNSLYESFLKKENKEKLMNNFYNLKKCQSSDITEILKNLKQHTEILLQHNKENNVEKHVDIKKNQVFLIKEDKKIQKNIEKKTSIFDEDDCF